MMTLTEPCELFQLRHRHKIPAWQPPRLSTLGEDLFKLQSPPHHVKHPSPPVPSLPKPVETPTPPLTLVHDDARDSIAWRSTAQSLAVRCVGYRDLRPDCSTRAYGDRFLPETDPHRRAPTPWASRCVLGLRAAATTMAPTSVAATASSSSSSACESVQRTLWEVVEQVSKLEQFVARLFELQPTHRALADALTMPGSGLLYSIRHAARELPLRADLSLIELDAKSAELRTSVRRLSALCRALDTSTASNLLSSLYSQVSIARDWWPEFEHACWPLVEGIQRWLTFGEIDPRVEDFLVETATKSIICSAQSRTGADQPWEALPAQPGWSSGLTLHFPSWIPQSLLGKIKDTGLLLRFIKMNPNLLRHDVTSKTDAFTWSDCSWEQWDSTFGARCTNFAALQRPAPPLELAFTNSWDTWSRRQTDDELHHEAVAEFRRKRKEEERQKAEQKQRIADEQRKEHEKKVAFRHELDAQVAKKVKQRIAAAKAKESEEAGLRFVLSPKVSKAQVDADAAWLLEQYGAEARVDNEVRRMDWRLRRLQLDARRQEFEAHEMGVWRDYDPWWHIAPSTLANRVEASSTTTSFLRQCGPSRIPEIPASGRQDPTTSSATEGNSAAVVAVEDSQPVTRVAPAQDSTGFRATMESPMPSEIPAPRPSALAVNASSGVQESLLWQASVPSPVREGASLQAISLTWDSAGVQDAWAAEATTPQFPPIPEDDDDGERRKSLAINVTDVEEAEASASPSEAAAARALLDHAYKKAATGMEGSGCRSERWSSREVFRDDAPIYVVLEDRVIGPLRRHVAQLERTLWTQLSEQWDVRGHTKSMWRVALFMDGTAESFVTRVGEIWRQNATESTLGNRIDSLFRTMPWADPYIETMQCVLEPIAEDDIAGSDSPHTLRTVIRRLTITFREHFPWGALLSSRAVEMYNDAFRLLATVKVAHSDLRRIWIGLQTTRTSASAVATQLCLLHHELLHSITTFDLFVAHVLTARFFYSSTGAADARSLSEWQKTHDEQLEYCASLCFLTPRGVLILDLILDICDLCGDLHGACGEALSMDTLLDLREAFECRKKELRKIGMLASWGWDPAQKHLLSTI